ncbi:MAG: hypothetical protein RIR01_858, partial [Bacteroidota bacterium]
MKYILISFLPYNSKKIFFSLVLFLSIIFNSNATTGKWTSKVTGGTIEYKVNEAKNPIKDYNGNFLTVVYLENLSLKKIGKY